MMLNMVRFASIVCVAVAMVVGLARLFELPNKMVLVGRLLSIRFASK